MTTFPYPPEPIAESLSQGLVIPAHPLALTSERRLDERRQRALTRYYLAAGAGGLAVGVHTTQFEIRQPKIGLLQPVLELAGETIREFETKNPGKSIVRIAGICGKTKQAVGEAALAQRLGYHIGLLSLGAMKEASVLELLDHARAVAEIIPIMGFYLQPSVGGRILDYAFWRELCEIPNLMAIKIAPFNRYQTLDVVRAAAESGRGGDIALYTGNDDSIIVDLLTAFEFMVGGEKVRIRIAGGLLGHWACWTRKAVEQLERIHSIVRSSGAVPQELLTLAAQISDANAAFFDPAHQFAGCIAGIHEVLRRQGLMQGRWTLNPTEDLSPGQMEEIERVYAAYPHLNDDAFAAEHLGEWLE
ncbi:MAG: dihydrodipicolinate synthase family protein [Candidatus Omnitrophota bacterium]